MDNLTTINGVSIILDKPRIYADLNGGWRVRDKYVVPLNSRATESDMKLLGYAPTPGLILDFWTDDGDNENTLDPLLLEGVVQFDEDEQKWVAVTDWNGLRNASEISKPAETAQLHALAYS